MSRPGHGSPDTTFTYYDTVANFGRLKRIGHGNTADSYPDYSYTIYDSVGNLKKLVVTNANAGTYAFGYDALNRLTTANLSGAGAVNYSYTYSYNELGNIMSRAGTAPDLAYAYNDQAAVPDKLPKVEGGPQAVTRVVTSVGADWSYNYDARGNLDNRYEGLTPTHDYTFDVEGRLASVRTSNQTTTFFYDADGQRVMTSRPGGVVVYTPFPDYEREVAADGTVTERTTYSIAGQMVAVRSAGTLYYTYGDHLGSVVAMSNTAGGIIANSLARYDPFGNFRTWPGSNVNPLISDRGFTGHVHDNTGPYPTQNVGLIYMNARYYLPEVGRFVSADTIVPEPGNPQSYNRYSYVRNSPLNFADPTGHKECGAKDGCTDTVSQTPSQRLKEHAGLDSKVYRLWIDPGSVDAIQYYGNTEFAFGLSEKYLSGHQVPNYAYSQGFHGGIDLIADQGTLVYMGVYGVVEHIGDDAYSPWYIQVRISANLYIIIGHLNPIEQFEVGDIVTPSTLVGYVSSEQSHVHVEFWNTEGERTLQSPYTYMQQQVLDQFLSLAVPMDSTDSRITFHPRSDGLYLAYDNQPALRYRKGPNLNNGQPGYVSPWN